jgi:hypothetical protein
MNTRIRTKLAYAFSLAVVLSLFVASLALADVILEDGDQAYPYSDTILDIGEICSGSLNNYDIPVAIKRAGNYGANNVFKTDTYVSISVQSISLPPGKSSQLSTSMESGANQILLLGWNTAAQNTVSAAVISNVIFVAGMPESYSATITYRGIGLSSRDGSSLTRDDSMAVTATVVDCTPPAITPKVSGSLGSDGWYISAVEVSWTVVDNESAISSSSGCDPTTISSDTAGTTLICTATSAGGTASQSVTIKRDATAPTATFDGEPFGGEYYFGFVPPEPTCTASDEMSGPASCIVSGYGTSVGSHTLTATATDMAGNVGIATATYIVKPYELYGFFAPVDMGGVFNVVKGGSTVPMKFEVFAGPLELTDVAFVDSFAALQISCDTSASIDDIELTTTGGTSLRYDFDDGQFINNWQTPKKPGTCYQVTLTTIDGSTLEALFKLK